MNADLSEELTPALAALALEVAGLPFAWPDAATRSRMHSRFEAGLAGHTAVRDGWLGRGILVAAALLALGAGAVASASRSPVDLVRDPGGVVRDIIGSHDPAPTPTSPPVLVPAATPDDHGGDDGNRGRGGDDEGFDDNDGRGGDDGGLDDNSGPGDGDDGGLDDNSGPGDSDDGGLDDDSGPGDGDDGGLDDNSGPAGDGDSDDDSDGGDDNSGPGGGDDE